MGERNALVAAMVLAAAVLATPAPAAKPRPLPRGETRVVTDGDRFDVYKSAPAKLTVIDDVRRRSFRVGVDPGCAPRDGTRGGVFLLVCGVTTVRPLVLDVSTRAFTVVPGESSQPGPDSGYDPERDRFDEVGRHWLKGANAFSPHPVETFYDWRSGVRRTFGEQSGGTYTPRDLDDPDLARMAPRIPGHHVFARSGPYSVTQSGRNESREARDLILRRGGDFRSFGSRAALLDRCATRCESISIGGGFVSWVERYAVHGYATRTRKRFTWRFRPVPGSTTTSASVAHTRTRVYVSLAEPGANGGYRVHAIRWR